MKKFFISFFFIVGFIITIFYQRLTGVSADPVVSNSSNVSVTTKKTPSPGRQTGVVSNSVTVTKHTPTPNSNPAPVVSQGQYRDGTYTGNAVDASYGMVQVAATITNGSITDVNFLSYPNDRQHSIQVSNYAMPILRQEAIAVQNANVDAVSGASYTSAAFVQSLGSALAQAM